MKRLLLSLLWLIPAGLLSQITIDESLTTQELVQDILIGGSCAETANFISSTGTDFGDVNGIAAFDANGSDFPFQSGVILSSGNVAEAPGPNTGLQSNGSVTWEGDEDLENATGVAMTLNASFIQFDFIPITEQLSFNFIMASEEYNQQFECTFSDAFAFILTDVSTGTSENLAILPGTMTPIQVTNIHPEVPDNGLDDGCPAINEEFFDQYNFLPFNNENDSATNFNGQIVPIQATSQVIPGNLYTIKLVVGDDSNGDDTNEGIDTQYDIAVFLEAGSFNVGITDLGEDILVSNGNAVCEGDTVTLDATDPDAESYTWFLDDVEITGETMSTLTIGTPGEYSVQVVLADPEDCVINDSILVEFINQGSVNIGGDITSCEDALESFDTGLPPDSVTFVWTLEGMVLVDETGPSIVAASSGTYEVTATFDAGCVFSDAAISTINVTPVVDLGEDINSCLEDPITLDGTPSNVDPALVTYQWALNGAFIPGETAATLEVTVQGTYEVFVTLEGCTGSDVLIVNLANPDGSTCTENDLCMDAIALDCGDVVTGNTEGSTTDGAPTQDCGILDGDAPGNWYTFTGTGEEIDLALCNSDYDTKIQVYAGNCDDLVCIGGNDDSCGLQSEFDFLSEIGTEYFIYVFGFSTETDILTGNYELSITCSEPTVVQECIDADPLCFDESLILENVSDGSTAQEGIDYECLGSQPNPSWFFLEIEEAGVLDLEIVQNSEFDEDGNPIGDPLDVDFIAWGPFENQEDACTMLVSQNIVDCSFSIDATETIMIPNAMSGELYIVLITNPSQEPGFISLGQTGGNGSTNCDILIEFEVSLGEDELICSDTATSFEIIPTITGDIQGGITYLWSTGETTETITVSESGTYSVEVTADGFTVQDEIIVTFVEPLVDLGEDQVICDGSTFTIAPIIDVDINVEGEDDGTIGYEWSTGETTETIVVTESGTYTLTITTDDGCTVTDTILISIESPISINAGEDFTTCRDFENTLTATVDATEVTYQWFLNGDAIEGATSTTLDFTVAQTAVGTQLYTLEVTSALGCTSEDTVEVSLYDVGQCVISEGLSPTNVDGFNDTLDLTFLADRTGITNLQIFNRLGNVVFEQNEYVNQWRGQTEGGDDLPTGTYFYVINFDSEDPDFGNQASGWIYVNQE